MAAGSLKGVSVDGLSYAVAADADINMKPSNFTNERIAHSAGSMLKKTRTIQTIESVTLILNGLDRDNLARAAEKQDDIPLTLTDAAGNVYTTYGSIEIVSWSNQDNKVEVTMQAADKWNFAASGLES